MQIKDKTMTADLNIYFTKIANNVIVSTNRIKSQAIQKIFKCFLFVILPIILKVGALVFGPCIASRSKKRDIIPHPTPPAPLSQPEEKTVVQLPFSSPFGSILALIRKNDQKTSNISTSVEEPVATVQEEPKPTPIEEKPTVQETVPAQQEAPAPKPIIWIQSKEEARARFESEHSFVVLNSFVRELLNDQEFLSEFLFADRNNYELLASEFKQLNRSAQGAILQAYQKFLEEAEKVPAKKPSSWWTDDKVTAEARFETEYSFTVLDDFDSKLLNDYEFMRELFFKNTSNILKLSAEYKLLKNPIAQEAVLKVLQKALIGATEKPFKRFPLQQLLQSGALDRIFSYKKPPPPTLSVAVSKKKEISFLSSFFDDIAPQLAKEMSGIFPHSGTSLAPSLKNDNVAKIVEQESSYKLWFLEFKNKHLSR